MPADADLVSALEPFRDLGLISDVLYEVKSGKEATVFCCRACNSQSPLLAAKVYRPLKHRGFRNDAMYHTGRVHLAREGRVKRAAQAKSEFGREVQYATWIDHEWSTMSLLFDAGLDVPQPIHRAERAILMTYLGDEHAAAPKLHDAEMSRGQAERVTSRLLQHIEVMLDLHIVHGDLSPYNILFWNGRATIIDFPQAVDPRLNPAAHGLLARDIDNICRWAARHGVSRNAAVITRDFWSRFVHGELG